MLRYYLLVKFSFKLKRHGVDIIRTVTRKISLTMVMSIYESLIFLSLSRKKTQKQYLLTFKGCPPHEEVRKVWHFCILFKY